MILTLDADYDLDVTDLDITEVAEPILEGRWLLGRSSEVWEFEYDEEGDITLNLNRAGAMEVFLFDYGFSPVLFTVGETQDAESLGLSLPLTGLFLVRGNADGITLMEIDPEWLERLSRENPEERWTRRFGDRIVMLSLERAHGFLREHGDDPGAFRRYGVLRPLEGSQR
jgi:hypothetical protein